MPRLINRTPYDRVERSIVRAKLKETARQPEEDIADELAREALEDYETEFEDYLAEHPGARAGSGTAD